MANANVGRKNSSKYLQIIPVLAALPLELQSRIWTTIIFSNLNLKEVLHLLGRYEKLDYIIYAHLYTNTFILSRYMGNLTYLQISNVMGKILLKSDEFEMLLALLLRTKIKIQNLAFQREIFEILDINKYISTLVHYATNICFVYYEQLLELQNWDESILPKIKFLSLSTSNNVSKLKLKNLNQLNHIALNVFEYPIDTKVITKILSLITRLNYLKKLDIKMVVEKELELPESIFIILKRISAIGVTIKIEIMDNNLTYKNMKFDWLNERISGFCEYITDMSMNLNTDEYIDFHALKNYSNLESLKISLYYSTSKAGLFRPKNKKLKFLQLYYFDRQMKYSIKYLSGLVALCLKSCDISAKVLNSLPRGLQRLEICNCNFDADSNLKLPLSLTLLKYEMNNVSKKFPIFQNIGDLQVLDKLVLTTTSQISQSFLDKLPTNLKTLSISCVTSENSDSWRNISFATLKLLQNLQISGNSLEYDLSLLPQRITYLNFQMNVAVFKNILPMFLENLDISFNNAQLPICSTLNLITQNSKALEKLTIRSSRTNYDFSRLEYKNIKIIKIYVGSGLLSSKCIIKIGNIPSSVVRFEIISQTKETVLIVPRSQTKDTRPTLGHRRKSSVDSSPSLANLDSLDNSNRLVELGILEGVTEIREAEILKMNIDASMDKLKINNLGNKLKNENQKRKSKLKSLLRRN